MRRAIWPVLALLLACAGFGWGRFGGDAHALPSIVATLPGDEADFSREFDSRIRTRFPVGSSEDELVDYLMTEKFAPDWRRRDGANVSALMLKGVICTKIVRVKWRADAAGVLTDIGGSYESHCL